ncbi:MAG: CRISPR-associated helicase Cas3' [Cytophagales bacterium]|nr:CRISPR-associated helicase Cas3' [Cytophagales bacterium]
MLSFDELIAKEGVSTLLKTPERYLAHTPDETLSKHMLLVTHYFRQLVNVHHLEPLIDRQLLKLCDQSDRLSEVAKALFWQTILYHDFGKVNENFQRKLDNTTQFPESKKNAIDSQHSILSAFIYLVHQLTQLAKLENQIGEKSGFLLTQWTFALSHNIIRHHSSRLDDFSKKETFTALSPELCTKLTSYLECYEKEVTPQIIKNLSLIGNKKLSFEGLGFEWFSLIRLNFSLLTAADYYATSHYCNKWRHHYDSFGVIDSQHRDRHFLNLQITQPHNKALYQNQSALPSQPFEALSEKSNANLNKLRSCMAAEVIKNVRQHASHHLFYIEAPTGGGKTNMAFMATQELLQANPELNKVFYVFPFTTLVTQTQKSAIETLGLQSDEWIELHGRAAWKQKENIENQKDGLYGAERLDDIHNQFVNYPYTFLSHAGFFDILKANDKSSIYLMHRLANSVVVIDEMQAYNPDLWDKMAYLLKEYAEVLNIRFVVMSATLPKIGSLANANFHSLLPDAIERFFTNPNFADRVSFSDELLKRKQPKPHEKQEYLEWLVEKVHQKSEAYRAAHGKVRTIVECIFKKSATSFAALAEAKFHNYEIYVLSGTILEPKRKQIIQGLKSESNKSKNILLVTTQVVEAGVDIDMDLGFKNRSIVDSEEQLAGRVNRNVNKQGCTVYLFDLDDANVIYGKDRRYKETRNSLEPEYFNILRTKKFDLLYDKVKSWLARTNIESSLAGTAKDYQERMIGQLNFPGVDKEFTLIDQNNISVFVPLDLCLKVEGLEIFTKQQVQFLADFDINPIEEKLDGKAVFNLYRNLIVTHAESFTDRKQNIKMLQSIMSMFTFSLFADSKVVKELKAGGNQEEYGYLYLVSHVEVYDYELGLLDQKFSEMIFL